MWEKSHGTTNELRGFHEFKVERSRETELGILQTHKYLFAQKLSFCCDATAYITRKAKRPICQKGKMNLIMYYALLNNILFLFFYYSVCKAQRCPLVFKAFKISSRCRIAFIILSHIFSLANVRSFQSLHSTKNNEKCTLK